MIGILGPFGFIVLVYVLVPLAAGVVLSLVQSHLFLRHNPSAARRWPVVTGIGLAVGGVLYTLSVCLSTIDRHPPNWIAAVYLVSFASIYLDANGFLTGLLQFWLLRRDLFRWRYLIVAWISSFIGILASFGALAVYEIWLRNPIQDPVADQGDMIVWLQPAIILVTILVYGIGTSLMLAHIRKAAQELQAT